VLSQNETFTQSPMVTSINQGSLRQGQGGDRGAARKRWAALCDGPD